MRGRASMYTGLWYSLLFAFAVIYSRTGMADEIYLQRAYLDKKGDVHVVTRAGEDIKLTEKGRNYGPRLAEDRQTVAWHAHAFKNSSSVLIYRNGIIKTINGDPFIRDFWFVKKGRQIAVDNGGLHFAGVEILYDAATLKELDSVDGWNLPPDDKCPKWAQVCGGTSGH